MDRTVGLLGGGQLGQMLCEAANPLGIKVVILDNGEQAPAKQINAKNPHIDGSFTDGEKIRELARQVDILTVGMYNAQPSLAIPVTLHWLAVCGC